MEALQEYKEAAEACSPTLQSHSLPLMPNNILAQQSSLPQTPPLPLAPKEGNKKRYLPSSVSDESGIESLITATKVSRKDSVASALPGEELLDDNDPAADFARRLSDVVHILANREYNIPDSDGEFRTPAEVHGLEIEHAFSTAAAESVMALKFAETLQQILQDQEEIITKATKEHISVEAQRLATLITTQPPSAPAPAKTWQDLSILYRVAEEAALHGAQTASLAYQKYFCDEHLPTIEQARQLLQDHAGNTVDPRHSWLILEPENDPRFFCSTISRCPPNWRRTLRVPMNEDEMYACLTADAARYRSQFMTSSVQMLFGGNIERQNRSQYPVINMEREREANVQQQQQRNLQQQACNQPQPIYEKATGQGLFQLSGFELWSRERQPSFAMEVDETIGALPK
jgi:hypothetical protein